MRRTANAVSTAVSKVVSARLNTHLVLPLTLLFTLLLATCAAAAVIIVDQAGGGDYLTVQEGVDAAVNGDTIQVMAAFYTERVVVDGKCLTFEGSGPSGTAVFWGGAGVTLEFLNTPSPYRSYVRNINIGHSFDVAARGRSGERQVHTVLWTGSTVVFDGAVINGGAIGEADVVSHIVHTGIESYQSTFDWIIVSGDRSSIIEESFVFEVAEFSGWYEDPMTMGELSVISTDSWYDVLELPMLCRYSAVGDSVETLTVSGGFEASCEAAFDGCGIGDAHLQNDNIVTFRDCVVNQIDRGGDTYPGFPLTMERCLVGQFDMLWDYGGCRLVHNTFTGWFYYETLDPPPMSAMKSNIFAWYTTIYSEDGDDVAVTYNLFKHIESHVLTGPDSLLANIWQEDPRFCTYPPYFEVEDCSPCIGAAHDGGIIGAFGIGCDCSLANAVEETSWGRIKSLYR